MAMYRKVLVEFINVTSTNRGFKTIHDSVATYEQTKKGQSYFYPKRIVDADGIHTRPLSLYTIILCIVFFVLSFIGNFMLSFYVKLQFISCFCAFVYFLINFFKLLHNLFYITLGHINIRTRKKNIRRLNNYTRGRASQNFLKFFRKNLTVPKIVAQCRKRVIPYLYTLIRTTECFCLS